MKRKPNHIFLFLFVLLTGHNINAQKTEIKTGNSAPEIRLPTVKGDTATLSSLRGNLVLIDFWASWCAPCLEEQPELKKLYAKYASSNGPKKLEIFGVSLDSKKEAWQKAIRRYSLPWTQVSDLKFWRSPVANDYQIEMLPFNVLVDEKGYILALNLHGQELNDFIDSYLKKQ